MSLYLLKIDVEAYRHRVLEIYRAWKTTYFVTVVVITALLFGCGMAVGGAALGAYYFVASLCVPVVLLLGMFLAAIPKVIDYEGDDDDVTISA